MKKNEFENQNGFIQIPILIAIIVGFLAIGLSVKQYQNYQAKQIEKEKTAREVQQQKDLEAEKLKREQEIVVTPIPNPKAEELKNETPIKTIGNLRLRLKTNQINTETKQSEAEQNTKNNTDVAAAEAEKVKQKQISQQEQQLAEGIKKAEAQSLANQELNQKILAVIKLYQDEQNRIAAEKANQQLICNQEKNKVTQEYIQKRSVINSQIDDLQKQSDALCPYSNPYATACMVGSIYRQRINIQSQISNLVNQLTSLNTLETMDLNEVKMTKCGEAGSPLPKDKTQPIPTSYYSNYSLSPFYIINPDGLGGYDVYNKNDPTQSAHIQCDGMGLCTVYPQ